MSFPSFFDSLFWSLFLRNNHLCLSSVLFNSGPLSRSSLSFSSHKTFLSFSFRSFVCFLENWPQAFAVMRPAHPPRRWNNFLYAAELKRRFQSHPVNCTTTLLYRAGWVGGLSKEHAHKRLRSKTAKDTKFARVLKTTTLAPTKTMQACDTHTSTLCSSPQAFAVMRPAHPPRRWDNFLYAAELKRRFQSHLITQQSTSCQRGTGQFKTLKCCHKSVPRIWALTVTTLKKV